MNDFKWKKNNKVMEKLTSIILYVETKSTVNNGCKKPSNSNCTNGACDPINAGC